MFKNVQEWWNNLVAWLTGSTPAAELEAIEDLLDENKIRAFYNIQQAHLNSGGRSRFAQILRGGGTPSDRPDQSSFVPGLPAGLTDYEVNEWEGPAGKGWTLRVFASSGGKDYYLDVPDDGNPGPWTEIVPLIL